MLPRTPVAAMLAAAAGVALLPGCASDASGESPLAGTFFGAETPLGHGTVRTYLVRDERGEPASLGVELSESALTGLPAEARMYHLPLPKEAAGTQYTFVMFDWMPEGHGPEPIYSFPRFDFHFYMADEGMVMAIPEGQDPTPIPTGRLPADYFSPGKQLATPAMGVHWMDRSAPEFNGGSFTHTLIYGTWKGELIFLEPMITKAFLESRPNAGFALKQPAAFQRAGYYPRRYGIRHDAQAGVLRISLDELTWHEAAEQ